MKVLHPATSSRQPAEAKQRHQSQHPGQWICPPPHPHIVHSTWCYKTCFKQTCLRLYDLSLTGTSIATVSWPPASPASSSPSSTWTHETSQQGRGNKKLLRSELKDGYNYTLLLLSMNCYSTFCSLSFLCLRSQPSCMRQSLQTKRPVVSSIFFFFPAFLQTEQVFMMLLWYLQIKYIKTKLCCNMCTGFIEENTVIQ